MRIHTRATYGQVSATLSRAAGMNRGYMPMPGVYFDTLEEARVSA